MYDITKRSTFENLEGYIKDCTSYLEDDEEQQNLQKVKSYVYLPNN